MNKNKLDLRQPTPFDDVESITTGITPAPKTYEQGRSEMQAECVALLEEEIKKCDLVMYTDEAWHPKCLAVYDKKHAIKNAIIKLKELK